MDELLVQFLIEGPELVQRGSDALLELERRPDDRAIMDEAFRAIHTLKGSVGLFDLPAMSATLHAAEDALSAVRAGARAPDAAMVDGLLAILSQTERWLTALDSAGELPPDAGELGRKLSGRLQTGSAPAHGQAKDGAPGDTPAWATELALHGGPVDQPLVAIRYQPHAGSYFAGDDPIAIVGTIPGLQMLSLGLAPPAKSDTAYDPFECRLVLLAVSAAPVGEVRRALRLVLDQVELAPLPQANAGDLPSDAPTAGGTDDASVAAYRTMRVDAGSIEALAAMVDELVVARTTLGSLAKRAADGAEPREVAETLAKVHGTLDRLIGRTHQQVTRVRMTQVAPLLRRFPRVVRTMARALDKDIDVVIVDNGVEADKTVIDGLFEPLTHLLRNAVDHGVEAAAARISQGKPRKATIRLTAMAVDGRLILTIEDDGGGIDPGAIRAAVIAKGLRTQAQVAALDDAEIVDLIFLPGFSTATSVTDLSGRGVGMDAVRKAVQRLGGRLSISTRHQSGTTVRLAIPLSLTLTKVIVVESGGEAYGLPMDRVLQTMRLPAAAIFAIRAGHAFNWRGRAVPILPLAGLVSRGAVLAGAAHKIVVLQSGSGIVGLAVDAIQDRADVTVRPLDGLLAGLPGVTGSTLMGDGSVLMILDPEALVG